MGVSIDDVAAQAHVSTATVSRALRGLPRVSEATRAKVFSVAAELGYVPSRSASGLATGRTRTVGVLVPFVDRWYFGHAIEGIDQVLRENGYNLLLFSLGGYLHGQKRSFTESMVRKQIDALLVLSLGLSEEELRQLHHTDIPLLSVGGPVNGCRGVYIDDVAAATAAMDHLIGLGHRRIGHLRGGVQDEQTFRVPALRTVAFEAAMARAGLEPRPGWNAAGEFTVSDGMQAAARIFEAPGERPTALFCGSDEMALGAMFEAQRRGIRIPEELSLIGIDDHDFSAPAGLTTIAQQPWEHGRAAAGMLLAELGGTAGAVRDVTMPFELKVRRSTAPPPREA
ncbi:MULTISPECIES: LacI family DNA-binding transcriptional regulator [unclassified Arthrobacter]|uniref:LacI family DNA-binding transcriptional regulator n=1 Tax=unclassified Arthrobacter TaxID=235627 RepID=UPI00159DCEA3|nr:MULTISPECIES: LacI family DNA-binding transcriptional regulator [unclassified Arthrobacter]MCQ9162650.1 LacI family transcriptional regulator [Arthrobacter sp. STN4]NVM97367.1 LacI family transcriptional regulator [Arthrobacter sp. SDTb3-6]